MDITNPKDDDMGLMISAFTCHELGFPNTIPEDILKRVHEKRKKENYSNKKATRVLYGSPKKQALTATTFLCQQLETVKTRMGTDLMTIWLSNWRMLLMF